MMMAGQQRVVPWLWRHAARGGGALGAREAGESHGSGGGGEEGEEVGNGGGARA